MYYTAELDLHAYLSSNILKSHFISIYYTIYGLIILGYSM